MPLLLGVLLALELLQPFRPAAPYGPGHRGIDIRSPNLIAAPISGRLAFAGQVGGIATVVIEQGSVRVSLQPARSLKPVGTWIDRGATIAVLATAARYHCRDCLHIGVRLSGQYVDPLAFLAGRLQPVGRGAWVE